MPCNHCGSTALDHGDNITRCLDCHQSTGPAQFDLATLLALQQLDTGTKLAELVERCCGHGAPPEVYRQYQQHLDRLAELGYAIRNACGQWFSTSRWGATDHVGPRFGAALKPANTIE